MAPQDSQELPSKTKPTAQLNSKLDGNLRAYISAASAAGVGILALASSAEAKIIYTPANLTVEQFAYTPLDINNDGAADFQFYAFFTTLGLHHDEGAHGAALIVGPAQSGNGIWEISSQGTSCAAALHRGRRVGPKKRFQAKSLIMGATSGSSGRSGFAVGPWLNVKQGFLGLKFVIHGKTHYGWARVKMGGSGGGINATVTGYAYETVANKPIVTGQKKTMAVDAAASHAMPTHAAAAGLGRLAQGAAGLAVLRRREQATGE